MVDLCFLRPCWCSCSKMMSLVFRSSIFSKILAMGDRSDRGLWNVPMDEFLFGLGIGIIFDVFQMRGIVLVLSDVLYICVRNVSVLSSPLF